MSFSKRRPRGKGGVRVIDSGPFTMGELAELFEKLPERRLAASWVALVVDSVSVERPGVGETARALTVVAERLHGMKVKQTLEPDACPT